MNEVKIISKSTFLDKEVDVWGTIEKPLFRAKDVVDWLGLKSTSDVIKRIDEEERSKFNLGRNGGDTWFLTEEGLYETLLQSRKPIAKQFKKGVKAILHEIRTKGGYIATQQNDTPEMIMARALKVADETIKRNEERMKALETQNQMQGEQIELQKKEIAVSAPKAKYYDDTLASQDCITSTQVADDLGISAKALNQKLAAAKIIYFQSDQWHLCMPYKSWNLHGTRTHNYYKRNGSVGTKVNLVWNQRGKRFILALFNNDFNVKAALAEINGTATPAVATNHTATNNPSFTNL